MTTSFPNYYDVPNLPGCVRAQDSWIMLKEGGFHKGPKSRPQSAQLTRVSSDFNGGRASNQSLDPYAGVRPSTAHAHRTMPVSNSAANFTYGTGTGGGFGNPLSQTAGNATFNRRPTSAGPIGLSSLSHAPSNLRNTMKSTNPAMRSMPSLPKFVESDRVVCRFHAHFFQDRNWDEDAPIGIPTIETTIGRRLTVLFHVADQTIEIFEERTANTGFQGGEFYKRGPLLKTDGQPITLRDLAPGNSIQVIGITIYITDADTFTRDYFRRELRLALPPALERPEVVRDDLGAQYATGLGRKPPSTKDKKNFGIASTDYIVKRQGLDKTYQYLQYEGQVLCFHCVEIPPVDPFSDEQPVSPDEFIPTSNMRKFVMRYSLSDSNIELRAMKIAGEDAKIILKKNKLPKNWRQVPRGEEPQYYDMTDFQCGGTIDVYGRVFMITNCNNFTRDVYRDIGIDQVEVPVIEEHPEPIVHPIPQLGDGFLPIGRPEDTLATVYGMPRLTKNVKSELRFQNRTILGRCKLLTTNKIDASRSLQVTYFLEDNTVLVYEEVRRNAGIVGGTFLKRGRYVNEVPPGGEEPRFFKPTDIFLGNVIGLNGLRMQIIEMDNMSLLFCEAFPEDFPMFDTFFIVHNLVQRAIASGIDIRKEFSKMDSNRNGWLDRTTFINVLDSLGLSRELNDQELLTLVRRFKEGDKYLYCEMADLFSHASLPHNRVKYCSTHEITDLKSFLESARSRSTQWRRVLRKDPQCWQGKVILAHLLKVLRKHGLALPAHAKVFLADQFALSGPIVKQARREIAKLAVADNSIARIAATQRVDFRSKKRSNMIRSTSISASISSVNQENEDDDSALEEVTGAKKNNTYTKAASIMRGSNSNSSNINVQDNSEQKNVIDFEALCDAIYVCDWVAK